MKNLFIVLIVFLSSGIPLAHAGRILLRDRFAVKDARNWFWDAVGSSGYTVSSELRLLVNSGASDQSYSNAELISRNSFTEKNLDVIASSPSLAQGSRGWGYWNQSLDPSTSEIAFFIALDGPPSLSERHSFGAFDHSVRNRDGSQSHRGAMSSYLRERPFAHPSARIHKGIAATPIRISILGQHC